MRLDAGKWRNMKTKRKLNEEIIKLNYRIAELEERLCPCKSHDWKKIGSGFEVSDSPALDTYMINSYKCKRCGKIIEKEE